MSVLRKSVIRLLLLAVMVFCFCGAAYADSAEGPGTGPASTADSASVSASDSASSTPNVIIAYEKTTSADGPGGGWRTQEDGSKYYIKYGQKLTDCWEKIDEKWYRFNSDGIMVTGWNTIDGAQYYLTEKENDTHPLGSLYVSETTPDHCKVDGDGKMILDPAPDTEGVVRANPYGNKTCVEIVLSEQRVYAYRGAQLVLVSPCVTGNVNAGNATPAGDFAIYSKESNRTLKGTNNDGSKYESFVNFWMPFNGGVGLHDASWRKKFGGNIYISGGSHGCVNMPYAKAATLFSIAYVGMPVHVHN